MAEEEGDPFPALIIIDMSVEQVDECSYNIKMVRENCKKLALSDFFGVCIDCKLWLNGPEESSLSWVIPGAGVTKFKADTKGANLVAELKGLDNLVHVPKNNYSGFAGTHSTLLATLQEYGATHVCICGINTDTSIFATVMDSFQNKFETFVVSDAVTSSQGQEAHEQALQNMVRHFGPDILVPIDSLIGDEEEMEIEIVSDDDDDEYEEVYEEEVIEEIEDENGNIVEHVVSSKEVPKPASEPEAALIPALKPVPAAVLAPAPAPAPAPEPAPAPAPEPAPVSPRTQPAYLAPTKPTKPTSPKPSAGRIQQTEAERHAKMEIARQKDAEKLAARKAKVRDAELAATKVAQDQKAAMAAVSPPPVSAPTPKIAVSAPTPKAAAPAPLPAAAVAKPAEEATPPKKGGRFFKIPFSSKKKPSNPGPVGKFAAPEGDQVHSKIADLKSKGLQTTPAPRRKQKTQKIVTDTGEKWDKKGNCTRTIIKYITEPDGTKRTERTKEFIPAPEKK